VGHAGEDVVVQLLLIRAYGGCGILPSGTYHLGLPTLVADRSRNAVELFADLIQELEPVGERLVPSCEPEQGEGPVTSGDRIEALFAVPYSQTSRDSEHESGSSKQTNEPNHHESCAITEM
jgi:hypothetical protein